MTHARGAAVLRHNLLANYAGQAWAGLMQLAFIPLYIRYLGIEAYGLIGIFALLQTWLIRLDMGLTPTLSREMARSASGAHTPETIRDLLRSVEAVGLGIAVAVTLGVWVSSGWLARDWLRAEHIPPDRVAGAIAIMGVVAALRFVEGLYRSSLIGLQRQVLFNGINVVMATIRAAGAVAVLAWVSPTVHAFFLWQGVVSLATLVVLAAATYRVLPRAGRAGRVSIAALRAIRQFAGGMVGITVLATLLTQVDKIILSRLLLLTDYGYYTLAAVVSGSLYLFVGPIGQAWFPRLSELHGAGDTPRLVSAYHQGAQLVSVIAGSAGIVMVVFAEPILSLWTQDAALAGRTALLVKVLAIGNVLNMLMWMPYKAQLAHGWTGLTLRINLVSVLVLVPAILWAVPRYGAIGAAWIWVVLNAGYVLVGVHFMYRRILCGEKARWYTEDVLAPLSAAGGAALLVRLVAPTGSAVAQLAAVLAAVVLAMAAAFVAAPRLRHGLLPQGGRRLGSVRSL